MKHVFIVGSKGIPGNYGGYETFVDKLTEYHQDNAGLCYHVACKGKNNVEKYYHNARCFFVKVPSIGPAQAIYYDVFALKQCCSYIKKNNIKNFVVYVLACRIGPFACYFQNKIHKLGGKLYVNPDGHEWMREKWSAPVRRYWKYSEKHMVKHADLLVCDSKNIAKYIKESYKEYSPRTEFIAYGAEVRSSKLTDEDEKVVDWYKSKKIERKRYYLIVGRFVPENNYETMIREFMSCNTDKDLAIITNVNNKFLMELQQKTNFESDARIKFVGTVYDKELLMKIRENAYGYLHGHEVGGTNPSLLEALATTQLNLLLDVGFNKEVAEGAALYWGKGVGELKKQLELADKMSDKEIEKYGERAKERIRTAYSWKYISDRYETLFLAE